MVTDGVAQVPSAKAQDLGIAVIPVPIMFAGRVCRDGVNLTAAEVYRRMREEKALPTISHPSVGEGVENLRRCLQHGARAVLYVGLLGPLSDALKLAMDAVKLLRAEFPDRTIVVLDTKTAAIAQRFIAMEAARAAASGASLEEVIKRAPEARRYVGFAATLETLEYLAREGRIGRAARLLGTLSTSNRS